MGFEAQDVERARAEVRAAYSANAARVEARGFRDNPTYIATKALVDWDLLDGLPLEESDVLNVGCFEPVDELHFAHRVRTWTAIDVNPDAIAVARRIVSRELAPRLQERLRFQVEDGTRLSFPAASFDVVVSFSSIEHIPGAADRRAALAEMTRVLRPQGHLVVTVPNRYSTFLPAHLRNRRTQSDYGYSYLYSPLELRREIRALGLELLKFSSEWHGLLVMPSFMPKPLKDLLFPLVYLGERIGVLARKPGSLADPAV
ncbi:MAG TPA: class I SAM-dependent methyltransferase [Candidatus Polarisedimenticolia bacterium]|nr:class I SAM-dependent methyltransferase [Candidatus Polarisedimenticolia bacterium]